MKFLYIKYNPLMTCRADSSPVHNFTPHFCQTQPATALLTHKLSLEDSTLLCLTFDSQFWIYRTNFVHYENPHWLDIDESFNKCQQWWACSCLTVWSTQMTLSQWHVPLSQDMKYHNDYITHLSITMAPLIKPLYHILLSCNNINYLSWCHTT